VVVFFVRENSLQLYKGGKNHAKIAPA